MPTVIQDARAMVARMTPVLRPDSYIFLSTQDPTLILQLRDTALCIFREKEGTSMIVEKEAATAAAHEHRIDIDTTHPMRRIVLEVYSSLDGFGLTAAVATALSEAGIACNTVAAFHHDHVFVPAGDAEQGVEILKGIQRKAQEEGD